MMKTTNILLLIIFAGLCNGCGDSKEKKENENLKTEIQKLKTENASLKTGEIKMKTSIDDVNKFLKEIEHNLADVDANKMMITKLSGEKKDQKNVRENIKEHISTLKELMENSRLKIIALDRTILKLRKENGENSDEILTLDKQVKALTNDLLIKDSEIEKLDIERYDLQTLYEFELQKSAELWSIINRAYYLAKSAKELKALGVVEKEGGFIGLGRVKVLNANASDSLFTKIKKNETSEILLNAKKAKLVSNHVEGSYNIVGANGKADKLVIVDRKLFWKDGNYLIIEVDK